MVAPYLFKGINGMGEDGLRHLPRGCSEVPVKQIEAIVYNYQVKDQIGNDLPDNEQRQGCQDPYSRSALDQRVGRKNQRGRDEILTYRQHHHQKEHKPAEALLDEEVKGGKKERSHKYDLIS